MKARQLFKLLFFTAFFAFSFNGLYAQEEAASIGEITGDAGNGYELFEAQCTVCHSLDNVITGPALRGVVDRLPENGLTIDWLHAWIKNSPAVVESGDPYAVAIFNEYNQTPMNVFEGVLSDGEISDVIAYLADPEKGQAEAEAAQEAAAAAEAAQSQSQSGGASSSTTTGILIVGFAVLAVILIWILVRLNALVNLTRAEQLTPEQEEDITDFSAIFQKYQKVAGALLGLFAFLALYGFWNFLLGVGVDKGYEPEQPIYFSHKIHAGVQGIDCQYCHTTAKYSKFSNIPSSNLCMNCHKVINEYKGDYYEEELVESGRFENATAVKEFYTEEIQKMYASIGWDPVANDYTGEQKPLKWTEIHALPDFVYFPHAQHVTVGEESIKKAMAEGTIPNHDELKVDGNDPVCYACHGDVSEMDEVYMANKLTMGWCIECHRSTEVDMENEYNAEYYHALHERLKEQYKDDKDFKFTVDAIGGIECGKCHY